MDDKGLQQWVESISLESFGLPFLHEATFNGRLRSTGGRYFPTTHNIDISRAQFESYGPEETEKIIKHELCHYHLHLQKRGYQHRDPEFKALLQQVGGTRFCQRLPGQETKRLPYRYMLTCTGCGIQFKRKRKVDLKRYVCGKCRGRLRQREIT